MSLIDAFNVNKTRAEKKACCDFVFHSAVYRFDDKVAKEMETLAREKGVNSFKVFMAYKDWMINDEDMIKVFKKCKELGAIPLVHAENGDLVIECTKKVKSLGK